METDEIRAYQRGWNDGQDWRHPHANPYRTFTNEWYAYATGLQDGGLRGLADARLRQGEHHAGNH